MLDFRAPLEAPTASPVLTRDSSKFDTESLALTLLLGMLLGLVAISMDSVVAAIPAIQAGFGASAGEAQMVLGAIMLGFLTGQIAAGPLADRFGRRPMLLGSLFVFLVSVLVCAMADSLFMLCTARFFQGIGAVFGPVLVRAIVRDLLVNEAAARLLGRVTLAFAIMPILMPLMGGFLVTYAGWRAIFWAQALLALMLLAAVYRMLPETAPAERQTLDPVNVLRNYWYLLSQRPYRAPTALTVCSNIGVNAFVTNSALIAIPVLGYSPQEYSALFALVMIGYISGARLGSHLVMRLGVGRMIRLGCFSAACGGALMTALALAGVQHGAAIVLPMAIYMFSNGAMGPSTTSASLSPFPRLAGLASSLQSVIQLAFSTVVVLFLSALHDGTTRPLACAVGLCGLAQWLLQIHYARKGDLPKEHA